MIRIKPVTNEIYHVYNRGVDKRKIFLSDEDHCRFIHDLFEFNDVAPAIKLNYYFKNQYSEVGSPNIKRKPRKMIVEIMAFCLMPNHFHLILKQKEEDGIADFMQKLGAGYTGYFNQKYERSGVLFQGKYKFIRLINEPHFVHLPNYIHLNPLSIENPDWKDKGFKNYKEAISFLEKYRWSSFLDYIGKKNFPSVTQRDLLLNFFKGPENYKEETFKWLEQTSSDEINDLITF